MQIDGLTGFHDIEMPTPSFDERWKALTCKGNEARDRGNFQAANELYALAYHEARMMFAAAWNGQAELADASVPMMIVSAGNAARNWESAGRADMGFNQLTAGARIFIQALKSRSAHTALKGAVCQGFSRLLNEIEERRATFPKVSGALIEEASEAVLSYIEPTSWQ